MAVLHHGRTNVYSLEYHSIFVTKYRKKVLDSQVRQDAIVYIRQRCKQHGVTLVEANGEEDHLHLLIDATPNTDIPNLLKTLKGSSARHILLTHPNIKQQLWGGHLWSPSYFICTVSENTEQMIRDYIHNQGETKPDQEYLWQDKLRRNKRKATKKNG